MRFTSITHITLHSTRATCPNLGREIRTFVVLSIVSSEGLALANWTLFPWTVIQLNLRRPM